MQTTNTGMDSMSGMQMNMMSLNWNTECVIFLFQTFHTQTIVQFLFGCFIVLIISVLIQLLHLPNLKRIITGINPQQLRKISQNKLSALYFQNLIESDRQKIQQKGDQSEEKKILPSKGKQIRLDILFKARLFSYHFLSSIISILLMLLAMSMNCFIILSIAVGTGVGKILLQYIKTKQNSRSMTKKEQQAQAEQQMKEVDNLCEV